MIKNRSQLVANFCLLGLLAGIARAQEGGIEIFTGETLFSEGWRTNVTEIYRHRSSSAGGGASDDSRTVLAVDYGVSAKFGVGVLVSAVHREFRFGTGNTVRVSGFSDVSLFAKRRLWHEQWRGGTFAGAAFAGVELPTGRTDEFDAGVRVAPQLQAGSGSTNPFLGMATTFEAGLARFDLSGLYKFNTEGSQGLDRGDFFALSLTGGYRVVHEKYPGPTLGLSTGLLWRHQGRGERFGLRLADSGSDTLSVRFAAVFHPRPDWDLALRVDTPIAVDSNGTQFEDDVRVALTVGIRF